MFIATSTAPAAVHTCRLGWPELLEHPFVRETAAERLAREAALAAAVELADCSRAWKARTRVIYSAADAHSSAFD